MSEPITPWVDGLTIGAALRQTAERHGSRDALIYPHLGLRMDYHALDAAVDAVAKALLAHGIRKGDHVAIWATNVPEWVLVQLGTARMGAVLVTINPAYRSFELGYVLKQGDIKALFLIEQFKTSNYYEIFAELDRSTFPVLEHVIALHDTAPEGMLSWSDFLMNRTDDTELHQAEADLHAGEKINIQYTSGTTGFPKAAQLTHRNILMNGWYVTGCQNIEARDRMCIPVPYYHCFGLVMGTLGAVTRGAAMIIPAAYFNPAATLAAVEFEHATILYGVPTMFVAMLDDPTFKERNLSTLRSGIMAGSTCPIEIMKRVTGEMHLSELTIAYGQTESSPVITQTRIEDALELRVETVGRALPGVEVRIVDEEGNILGEGEQGELCSRGHGTMLGYYKDDDATAAAIDEEGWLHTGDIAKQHADGYYSITGRKKDMVIRGGENIYPREIEEFLFTHPAISQVTVVGVPDAKYGEELCAWVQLHPNHTLTCEEVKSFCNGKLAHYKIPRYLKCVDSFPQTVSGKIQKFKIREQMCEELGLVEYC